MTGPTDRRHATGVVPAWPWVITAGCLLLFATTGALWAAAHLAADHDTTPPAYSAVLRAMRTGGVRRLIGPHGSVVTFWAALAAQAALAATATTVAVALITRRGWAPDGLRSMSRPRAFRDLQHPAMAERAKGLRPSLAGRRAGDLGAREVGAVLGDIGGTRVFKSHEDVALVICGPRSNKTSAVVVPDILGAPGTVIATSNKPDVWLLTERLRAAIGPVWLFDPQQITYQSQAFWWDPLATVTDVPGAARLASYFMREVGGENAANGMGRPDPFFTPAAAKTLRQLLLAAACSGHTLRDVVYWVATRAEEPAVWLERGGYAAQAASLRSTLELPPETKGGIFEGVATALACLDSEALLRWVTPPGTWDRPPEDPATVRRLDLWSLITQPGDRQPTVYLLSREGEGTGRPVVAAIVGELIQVAVQAASARGGRLDPPITLQLDEAANIVRLPELPSWMSWFGSLGLMVTVVLQSREQGRSVWGREGFDALWSAATIKTVGAGVQDADFCEDLSRLVGDHKIEETSTSSSTGGHTVSRSLHTQRILTAADIAALERTRALLFTSGRRPALLRLHPWYAEPDDERHQITTYAQQATREVQRAAIAYLGPDNPVAAALTAAHATTPDGAR
jgi:type IV secretory pathway TraG/TraD family ATPase VirD4